MSIDISSLTDSIERWHSAYLAIRGSLVPRGAGLSLPSAELALALTGVRRCGKTTTAVELSRSLPEDRVLYYNFEDPLFIDGKATDLEPLLTAYRELRPAPPALVILDEIQNVVGWERWVRTLVDQRRSPVIITGSNAQLLSSDFSSSLTGRALTQEIWPLSFSELIPFLTRESSVNSGYVLKQLMEWGGLPLVHSLSTEGDERQQEMARLALLRQYLSDIVHRDVVNRASIRNKRALDVILTYYFTNLSSLHSYSAIKKAFDIPVDTVADYTESLKDAYLVFEVARYHRNMKVQARDARKVYVIDNGLRRVGAQSPEADVGKLLENQVFLHLRSHTKEIFHYSGKQEVDFVVTQSFMPKLLIQVCADGMEAGKTRERELAAMAEGLKETGLKRGLVITLHHNEKLSLNGADISCISADRWLRSKFQVED